MRNSGISREEMVRWAMTQLGSVSDEELAAFVERENGVKIEVKFLPIVRASLRARKYAEAARARGRQALSPKSDGSKSEQPVDDPPLSS
jgi:hypothetical protein